MNPIFLSIAFLYSLGVIGATVPKCEKRTVGCITKQDCDSLASPDNFPCVPPAKQDQKTCMVDIFSMEVSCVCCK
ncbi:hypothetical protein PZA11_002291 [Diplocarpon coronariae]